MAKITAFVTVILLFACSETHQSNNTSNNTKTLDFGAFTIETPSSWEKVKVQGLDSYVGEIALDEKDTVSFDLGWYSNKLTEYTVTFLDSADINEYDSSYQTDQGIVFVKNRFLADPDEYRKTDFRWDSIDGRQAKIVYPRKSGKGITGIYIDSLWTSGSDVDRFNLYGENLKPENEKKFLSALRTLKFHKKNN